MGHAYVGQIKDNKTKVKIEVKQCLNKDNMTENIMLLRKT